MVGQEGYGSAAWCLAASQGEPSTPLFTKSFQANRDLSSAYTPSCNRMLVAVFSTFSNKALDAASDFTSNTHLNPLIYYEFVNPFLVIVH